jgi:hypothetical protein
MLKFAIVALLGAATLGASERSVADTPDYCATQGADWGNGSRTKTPWTSFVQSAGVEGLYCVIRTGVQDENREMVMVRYYNRTETAVWISQVTVFEYGSGKRITRSLSIHLVKPCNTGVCHGSGISGSAMTGIGDPLPGDVFKGVKATTLTASKESPYKQRND